MNAQTNLVVFFPVFKKTYIPENEWIKAISVGDNNDYDLNDRYGDSLAHLNRFYNELTAIYWVWKNYPLPSLVGFSNYRKWMNHSPAPFFPSAKIYVEPNKQTYEWLSKKEQKENILKKIRVADLILPHPEIYPLSISAQYKAAHYKDVWEMFVALHPIVNPEYTTLIDWYNVSNTPQFFQNFVMRRSDFCQYCEELFFIINRVYKHFGNFPEFPGLRFQEFRYPAYLAERFLMFFAWANRRRVITSQVVLLEKA